MRTTTNDIRWLAAIVLGHLMASLIHGGAHQAAHVQTTPAQDAFILIVIVLGPLAGLWLARTGSAAGGWLVAATMAGSLAFGLINHFVIAGADRVDHVTGPWASWFASTASILVLTEILGTGAGVWFAMRRTEQTS
jgi:hypothetical protein